MARQKQTEPEILPGLTASELQALLASVNQDAVEGAAHLVTVREYAAKRRVNIDRARDEIRKLIEIGKARFGGNKPIPTMNGRMASVFAYEITL